jgi:hypothetical protein
MDFELYTLPDIGFQYTPKKYVFKAVCLSDVCNELRPDGLVRTRSEKNVKRTTVDCPDCEHILFWEKHEVD